MMSLSANDSTKPTMQLSFSLISIDSKAAHCADMSSYSDCEMVKCACASLFATPISSFDTVTPIFIKLTQSHPAIKSLYSRTISPELQPPLV